MTFSRINGPGWAVGDKFTSAQANALDIQLTNALDKSTAGDNLLGTVNVGQPYAGVIRVGMGGIVAASNQSIQGTVVSSISATAVAGIQSSIVGGIAYGGGSTDWPSFASGITTGLTRTLIRAAPCVPFEGILIDGTAFGFNLAPIQPLNSSTGYTHQNPPTFGTTIFGALFSTTSVQTNSFKSNAFCISLNQYLQDGATLTTATLNYYTSAHSNLPYGQPFFILYRLPSALSGFAGAAYSIYLPMSTSGTAGVVQDSAASVAAYSNQARSIAMTVNQYNVIDKSQYNYIAMVGDEYGTNAASGNAFGSIVLSQTIHDHRPG